MKTRTSIGEQFFIDIRVVRDGRHDESGIARFPAYLGLWGAGGKPGFLDHAKRAAEAIHKLICAASENPREIAIDEPRFSVFRWAPDQIFNNHCFWAQGSRPMCL